MAPMFDFKDSLDTYVKQICDYMDNHPNKKNSSMTMDFEVTVYSGPNRPAYVAMVYGRAVEQEGYFTRTGRKIDAFIKGL